MSTPQPNPTPTAYTLRLVRALIAPDLAAARGTEDLLHRLAAKGYGLREAEDGPHLVTLPHGVDLGRLPSAL